MYGKTEDTKVPRLFLACNHLIAVFIVWWLCFGSGIEYFGKTTGTGLSAGDYIRRIMLLACSIVYFLRILVTGFILLKRKMEASEAIVVALWIYIINIVFALSGGTNTKEIGAVEAIGVMLYLAGSYLNTGSEYLRYRWRQLPENAGKLYTQGLFKHSRHINYFGDVVLFTGFSLVTGRPIALIIPVIMTLSFIFINIPMLDRHLENKYPNEFVAYKKRTKAFVPFIY